MLARTVIYTIPDGRMRKREERAAIVVRVVDAQAQVVDLHVFGVGMSDWATERREDAEKPIPGVEEAGPFSSIVRNVPHNARGLPGTWRFPPTT